MRWRFDGKCGEKYPLPDGAPNECDPDGERPCCNGLRRAECGNTTDHCTCVGCIDYRLVRDWKEAGYTALAKTLWINQLINFWSKLDQCQVF